MIDPFVVVQHHPSRAHLLPKLRARLDGLETIIVVDPGGSRPDPWRCYRVCLTEAIKHDGSHVVVLQDDAEPSFDFACHLRCAIEAEPEAVLVLFLAAQPRLTAAAATRARGAHESFAALNTRDWLPAVAVSYPKAVAADISRWAEDRPGRHTRSDDHMLGQWHRDRRHHAPRVLVTVPSLVDHPDDVPSLIGNGNGSHGRNPSRVALHWDG